MFERIGLVATLVTLSAACGSTGSPEPAPSPDPTPEPAESADQDRAVEPPPEPAPSAEPASPSEPPAAQDTLAWRLIVEPERLTMAHRADFFIHVEATNGGDETVDPQMHAGTFEVNGETSMALELAFSNGIEPAAWSALRPGQTVRASRQMGESLFSSPGDYAIVFTHLGQTASAQVHVDP